MEGLCGWLEAVGNGVYLSVNVGLQSLGGKRYTRSHFPFRGLLEMGEQWVTLLSSLVT